MGKLFTEEVGKVLTRLLGNYLTRLLGNYLTEALGKVLDIYSVLDKTVIYSVFANPNYFLLPTTNVEYSWPQEAYLYALSFILSSLVRYHPDYWHREVIGKRKNRWVIRRLNSIMERIYPNMMVNIMFNARIKFGSFFW